MAILLPVHSLCIPIAHKSHKFPSKSPNPLQKPLPTSISTKLCNSQALHSQSLTFSKRDLAFNTAAAILSLTVAINLNLPSNALEPPPKLSLLGISNTKSWFRFVGNGFSIRVPPQFEDIMEPEDYTAGLSLYGDRAKPKTLAARFASPDRSEMVSVVIRPTNQLKITFLEAQDITELGSLKEAARIFVPGGAALYSARAIKIKEDEGLRTYYLYEFSVDDQHVALVAAVNSGKAFIAGAAAPQFKWEDDGVKLRSAAISLSVL